MLSAIFNGLSVVVRTVGMPPETPAILNYVTPMHHIDRRSLGKFIVSFIDYSEACISDILNDAKGHCYKRKSLEDPDYGAAVVYNAPCSQELRRMFRKVHRREPPSLDSPITHNRYGEL
jgi:hypothetical protein